MADFAGVLDARQEDAAGIRVCLLFVLGNLVGLAAGVEWFEVAGAAVQGFGFAAVGARLLPGRKHPYGFA